MSMRAEELDTLTEKELLEKANICFITAEDTNINFKGGETERLRLHLEAQFYLTAAARKRDDDTAATDRRRAEEIAERDFRLERRVIQLIGLEIILSIIFGGLGLWEGYKQGQVLDRQAAVLVHMDKTSADTSTAMNNVKQSTARTAAAMQAASTSLTESLDRLKQILGISQRERADRLAQLASKPKLVLLLVGRYPPLGSLGTAWYNRNYPPLRPYAETEAEPDFKTDTSAHSTVILRNVGNATASRLHLEVRIQQTPTGKVLLETTPAYRRTEPGSRYELELDSVRPGKSVPIEMTFSFHLRAPKAHNGLNR